MQTTQKTKTVQREVHQLKKILPLDELRIGEEFSVFEDEDGTIYIAETAGFDGLKPPVARLEAGKTLDVAEVDEDQLEDLSLTRLDGQPSRD
jgi:hypothetical protein